MDNEKQFQIQVADKMIEFANKNGLWETIEFIVSRWIEINPEEFESVKQTIKEEKDNLQDSFGTNEKTRGSNMAMRRVLEIPNDIHSLINTLFLVEKKEYPGGDKEFWREFSKRFPVFTIGK